MKSNPTSRAALMLAIAVAAGSGACAPKSKTVTFTLPPGLVEQETDTLVRGHRMAADAYDSSNPERSLELYKEAVQTYGQQPAAWNNMGVLYMNEGNYFLAQQAFRRAAEQAPSDPRPKYNLGLLWDKRGYVEEAKRFYIEALDRNDSYLPALRGAIRADSVLQESDDQTLEWLERALFLERDEKWKNWLLKQRIDVKARMAMRTGS